MAKKGAKQSGSAGLQREKDQSMARHLPPAPKTWRRKAWEFPYHNNAGSSHGRNKSS